jgi:hypothetical protein
MRAFTTLFLALLAVGCGGDATGPTTASVAGTWSLQSINGIALPYVVAQTGGDKVEITGDVFTAVATGSFTQLTTVRTTLSGQVTTQSVADAGSWSMSGTAVTFQFNSNGSVGTGSLSGNTLTVTDAGYAYIYRKQ